jgi:hypothetical protein
MVQWFCDRCGKEILPEAYSLHVEIQEEQYKGGTDFFIDGHCLSTAKLLCDRCNEDLKEFFNSSIKSY